LFVDETRRKTMARLNAASKETTRRARATAIEFDKDVASQFDEFMVSAA
jgi:hypothetical protein